MSEADTARAVVEFAQSARLAIGAGRVGIRLSPCGVFNGTGAKGYTDDPALAG